METLEFGWEPLEHLLGDPAVRELILAYYEELSPLKGAVPLAPDWNRMAQLDRAGAFCVWVARADGVVIGFISFHLLYHLNYRTTLFAMDAGHFLHPAFRDKGRVGFRMWRTVEAALREREVKIIMAHDNMVRPLMPFFLALGYEPRSTLFWKMISDA